MTRFGIFFIIPEREIEDHYYASPKMEGTFVPSLFFGCCDI